jgi:hypothetical protein
MEAIELHDLDGSWKSRIDQKQRGVRTAALA